MVEHYGKVEVPIKGALHVKLTNPVSVQGWSIIWKLIDEKIPKKIKLFFYLVNIVFMKIFLILFFFLVYIKDL